MPMERPTMTHGRRFYGLGMMALGLVCLAFGDFHPGQPVPKDFPHRMELAYAVATFMLVAGAAITWHRTAARAAGAIAAYFGLVVVLLMNGRILVRHYAEFGPYESLAIQLAIAAGGLILFATHANIEATFAERLVRAARWAFGLCALVFGVAHFEYMNLTAPLVPRWLPPTQEFWAYATGVAHIAAGIALLTGIQARLAATLLTIMFASFTPLVHVPMLLATPSNHWIWNENAVNLALIGAAWVVAASLAKQMH